MDLLNLRALLTLDKSAYEQGLNEASGEATGFGSKFKGAMGTAAKAGAAALAASATAVSVLGKNSISAYADTQQLVGGVQKLYGNMGQSVEDYAKSVGKSVSAVSSEWKRNEQAQSIVLENARNAFQTAGISYNQYMEQATSFSAALINSLGGDTKKAAEQTDVAMRAIADNYNTFGGDMGMIQYAFQGFAKQNYTMLDNLKLGYGGTKTEMQRLIDDANKWAEENGKAADLSIDSFSDVVTAIDYIQQKQNIAGTTAREASTTISGSIGMVKAAWENLMAGMADPDADISKLVTNLMESVSTAGKNLLPAIGQFAEGFGTALQKIAPQIISGIPKIIETAVPAMITSATSLMDVLISTIYTSIPKLLNVGISLVTNLVAGINRNANTFIQSGLNMLQGFIRMIISSATKLMPVALTLIQTLATGILNNLPAIIQTAVTLITQFATFLVNSAPQIITTGIAIIKALIVGIVKSIPLLIASVPKLITAIVKVFTAYSWVGVGKVLVSGIAKGMKSVGNSIRNAIRTPVNAVKKIVSDGFRTAKDKAVSYMTSLRTGIKEKIEAAREAVSNAVSKIKGLFPLRISKAFNLPRLPKIKISTGSKKVGPVTVPYPILSWNKKAMNNPYMFTGATLFGAGEAGDEMLYGKQNLMRDITEAVSKGDTTNNQSVIINLNYDASSDASDMARDIAKNVRRYRMAGAF